MRAIMVCVDFADILAVTLPYNRHHFEEVWIVTDFKDEKTMEVIKGTDTYYFRTDAFYRNGAKFNKWAALEEGLDAMGRRGWLCVMDADVLWPKKVGFVSETEMSLQFHGLPPGYGDDPGWRACNLWEGNLYTPRRRMDVEWHREAGLPPEDRWALDYPLHPQQQEFAGYSQVFHADDPHLGPAPWHQTDWTHCGGADSFFQAKWPEANKVRPPFEVLHLGEAGVNWFGRATPRADGTIPEEAAERRRACMEIWGERRRRASAGQDRFGAEKVGGKGPE